LYFLSTRRPIFGRNFFHIIKINSIKKTCIYFTLFPILKKDGKNREKLVNRQYGSYYHVLISGSLVAAMREHI